MFATGLTAKVALNPKVCYTAAGCLIYDGKVLLVKHKKLGFWLNPGGHIEENELPHQAAEREFFEETGVKVRAKPGHDLVTRDDSEYLPIPFAVNLHWVSPQNFVSRQADPANFKPQAPWHKGCEQHLGFLYMVEPVEGVVFTQNQDESDDIRWFTRDEIATLEAKENIKVEIERAFALETA